MNTILTVLFSTTLLYVCVNGGALRGQGPIEVPYSTPGVWQGPSGYGGAQGVAGSQGTWSGPVTYPGGSGGWSGTAGYSGASVWNGPTAHSGAPGSWSGSAGGNPGSWAGSSPYTGRPGAQGGWSGSAGGNPGSWAGSSPYTGRPGALGGWPSTSGYTGAPGAPVAPGSWSGPIGHTGAPVGYAGPTAVPQVLPDGSIADVPEVAAARAAHLAAVQVVASDPRLADADDGEYDPYKYGDHLHLHHDHHTSGPVGYHNGYGANVNSPAHANNLDEEAAWRAKQRAISASHGNYANSEAVLSSLIAKNAAAAATPSHVSGELVRPYAGPLATPQVLPSGYVADTVEVTEAKQSHLRALAAAEEAAARWEGKNNGWN